MDTLVMPLGSLPTDEGPLFAVLGRHPGGRVSLGTGTSWAEAADALAGQLEGPVRCGPALALHGRRLGWELAQPTERDFVETAAFALLLDGQLSPALAPLLERYVAAWVHFFKLRLWEQMPAELSLRALWRRGRKTQETSIAVMGQGGTEFGVAHYEDPATFDAMWSGEPFSMDGVSVLASDEPDLAPCFEPLGVPPPALLRVERSRPRDPRPRDYAMAAAVMELLFGVLTGEVAPRDAGEGATLEFKRQAPEERPPRKKQVKAVKKPAPKKKRAKQRPT